MNPKKISTYVHDYLINNLTKDDIVVDATIGNGHDTLLLCSIAKFVYGFDIQTQALINTKERLDSNNYTNYKLILDSHENILNYTTNFKGVVFNLGYLPGADKDITTKTDSTIKTLTTLTNHLKKDNFIIITCYPGHDEGLVEANAAVEFSKNLDNSFNVYEHRLTHTVSKRPPFVVVIEKK